MRPAPFTPSRPCAEKDGDVHVERSSGNLGIMALASGPALRALAGSGRLGLGGCGAPKRGAYEWGVRSTRKPEPRPLHRVHEIPGLEPITYEGKMHFVPWLAQPIFPPWDPGWNNPRFHRPAPIHEHLLYKDQPCYIFHQRCRLLEGEAAGQTGGDCVLCPALTPKLGSRFLPLRSRTRVTSIF